PGGCASASPALRADDGHAYICVCAGYVGTPRQLQAPTGQCFRFVCGESSGDAEHARVTGFATSRSDDFVECASANRFIRTVPQSENQVVSSGLIPCAKTPLHRG